MKTKTIKLIVSCGSAITLTSAVVAQAPLQPSGASSRLGVSGQAPSRDAASSDSALSRIRGRVLTDGTALRNVQVSAAPMIVTQWDYVITSQFDVTNGFTPGACVGTACYEPHNNNQTSLPNMLRWGVPFFPENPAAKQSSLEITGSPARSPAFGGGGAFLNTCINGINCNPATDLVASFSVPTQTFTHDNFSQEIRSSSLDKVNVITMLQLQEHQPAQSGSLFPLPIPLTIQVNFQETINRPSGGQCADGTLALASGCPDLFVLTANFDSLSFFYDASTQTLGPGPNAQQYFVSVFPRSGDPLLPLNPALCAAAGAPSPCRGFVTNESASTNVQWGFGISRSPLLAPSR